MTIALMRLSGKSLIAREQKLGTRACRGECGPAVQLCSHQGGDPCQEMLATKLIYSSNNLITGTSVRAPRTGLGPGRSSETCAPNPHLSPSPALSLLGSHTPSSTGTWAQHSICPRPSPFTLHTALLHGVEEKRPPCYSTSPSPLPPQTGPGCHTVLSRGKKRR